MKKYIALCLCLMLGGCQFLGTIYSVGDKVVTILMDDRPLDQDMADIGINAAVRQALIEKDTNFGLDIEVTVFENTVLLTGALPKPSLIDLAVKTAWSVDDVKQVINYIRLDDPSTTKASEDATTSAALRTQLSVTRGVSSCNYKLTMDNNIVYIMGITQDDDELDRVVSVIKNTPNVAKVIILTRRALPLLDD